MSVLTTEAPRTSRGGRPRDPSRDGVIRAAILSLLAEVGYGALTMDAVAAEAGVGKATQALLSTIPHHPALAEAFREGPLDVWQQGFDQIFARAEARGEIRQGS